MDVEKLIQRLMDSNDFFDRFEKNEIEYFLKGCSARTFEDGDIIFREGGMGSTLYIIISGSIVVTKKGRKVDIVRDGECLGEMGALGNSPRSANAEAIGKVTMLEIDNKIINTLSAAIQAKLYKNIALLISERLRKRLGHV